MNKIILGILMMKRMTVYDLRQVIGDNFQSMCSDSLGSIQAALKKLLDAEFVTYEETIENGRLKKRYAITKSGRHSLIDWVKVPIDMGKTKNIDLGKFLFMGLVSQEEQVYLLDQLIASLEEEYQQLQKTKDMLSPDSEKKQAIDYFTNDQTYLEGICEVKQTDDITEVIDEYSYFSLATLDYGIAITEFNLAWFKDFKKKYVDNVEEDNK